MHSFREAVGIAGDNSKPVGETILRDMVGWPGVRRRVCPEKKQDALAEIEWTGVFHAPVVQKAPVCVIVYPLADEQSVVAKAADTVLAEQKGE